MLPLSSSGEGAKVTQKNLQMCLGNQVRSYLYLPSDKSTIKKYINVILTKSRRIINILILIIFSAKKNHALDLNIILIIKCNSISIHEI